jgi:ornithine cyclodeaminase/alanine dehydrogenase-like protein (mu-crystallin family)
VEACLVEAGYLIIPIQEGAITREHLRAGLGEIVAGLKPGRERADERTMAMNLGLALDDMAVAPEVFRLARQKGLGTWLPL